MNGKVSVIIPVWLVPGQHGKYGKNEVFWMAYETVRRLRGATHSRYLEVVMVDNGSTLTDDDLTKDYRDYPPNVGKWVGREVPAMSKLWSMADVFVRLEENRGFSGGCNEGFRRCTGEYVVVGNDDIVVWPGWDGAMIDVLNDDSLSPRAGVVMPALMKETKDFREALKVDSPDLSQNFGKVGPGAEFGSWWMARKDFLDGIAESNGGRLLDEGFWNGKEDRWMWRQVRDLGYETYRTHATRVFHQGCATRGKVKDRKEVSERNARRLDELISGRNGT